LVPYIAAKSRLDISLMSAPAANAFSLPVSTAHPWLASASNASSAAIHSVSTGELSAFSACGRLSVMSVTPPSRCSTSNVS
jgi:hypothetical protein